MEINNKQCADPARCTSTEEWINAAAKAMADRSTITFIEAVLKASPMEVHDLLAAKYRKAMMHALSHQWRDASERSSATDTLNCYASAPTERLNNPKTQKQ